MSKNVVFMGTPSFAVPSLERLAASGQQNDYQITAVYTQPDREAGRGMAIAASPVKVRALELGLQVLQPATLKNPEAMAQMKLLKPDVVVVAAYGKLIPEILLSIPQHGFINLHPSLLPRYRGSSPISEAILNGDTVTGVTIMLLDAGMDSGPILTQREVHIRDEDTAASLGSRLSRIGADMLGESLQQWLAGAVAPRPQDDSQATFTRQLSKNDGQIDWNLAAVDIWRMVKAYYPWPGTYTTWQGKRLKIIQAISLAEAAAVQPGKVVQVSQGCPADIGVETGAGVLGLKQVQMEGRQETSAGEFVRGQRNFIGSILL